MEIDRLDRRLLRELQADGRLGNAELARRIGLDEVPTAVADLAAGADEIKVVVEHDRP